MCDMCPTGPETVAEIAESVAIMDEWEYATFEDAKRSLRIIQEAVVASYGGDVDDIMVRAALDAQNARIIRGLQLPPAGSTDTVTVELS